MSNEFGLFDVRDDFVVLKINGVPQGMYYLVEELDTTFLEYNQCSSCEIIRTNDNKMRDHPRDKESDNPNIDSWEPYGLDYFRSQHVTPFDDELSHTSLKQSDLDLKKVLNSVNGLYLAVKEDSTDVVSYFDINYLVSSEAQRMILGLGQIMGDNLKMVYKATNAKFYPITFEGGIAPLKAEKGGLERSLNIYRVSDSDGEREIELFSLLNKNDQTRQLKYKKAYDYISNNKESLLYKIKALENKYLPYANANNYNAKGTKVVINEIKSYYVTLKRNMDIIQAALEYAKCYINVIEKENKVTLEIIPDSISQLRFDSFKIKLLSNNKYSGKITLEYKDENGVTIKSMDIKEKTDIIDLTSVVKDFYFMTGLDEDLGTKKRVYNIIITFQDAEKILVDNIQAEVMNDITCKPLGDDEVYLQIANANDYYFNLISAAPNDFVSMYNEFNWDYRDDKLTLLKGSYVLRRDMIVPKSLTWDIEPGVQILIDQDKSMVSYSPVNIKGTESEPVVIKALDPNKPFGVFAVVGEKGFKTTIDWLKLSDGNEKFINGLYLSGQLSLYHTDVDIRNSVLANGHSDDGINIKYGKIMVDNCLFINSFGDKFDGDYVEGVIKNSRFIEDDPNSDDNGDGLDFSGSKVIVKNNLFNGSKDKGVSIGEDTKPIVLYDNIFENNHLGAAIKDASYAFFIKNSFKNNEIALSAYQKKIIYPGGGYFYLYDNEFQSNVKDYELDEKSYKEGLKLDEDAYNKIVEGIVNEDLDSVFQMLDPYIKK